MKRLGLGILAAPALAGALLAGAPRPGEPMAASLAAAAYAIQKVADAEGLILSRIAVHRTGSPVLAEVAVEADAPFWKLAALVGMADGSTTLSKIEGGRRIAFQVRLEPPVGPAPGDPAPHAPVADWIAFTDQKGLAGRCLRFHEGPPGAWQVTVEADAPEDLALAVYRRAAAKVGEARLTGIELRRPGSPQSRMVLSGYVSSPKAGAKPLDAPVPAAPAAPRPLPPGPAPAAWSEAGSWLQGYLPADPLEINEGPGGTLTIVR